MQIEKPSSDKTKNKPILYKTVLWHSILSSFLTWITFSTIIAIPFIHYIASEKMSKLLEGIATIPQALIFGYGLSFILIYTPMLLSIIFFYAPISQNIINKNHPRALILTTGMFVAILCSILICLFFKPKKAGGIFILVSSLGGITTSAIHLIIMKKWKNYSKQKKIKTKKII